MEIPGSERIAARNVREADEGMPDREQSRMIELEPGNAFAVRQMCRLGELTQLPSPARCWA
jgi:hypothetical protein